MRKFTSIFVCFFICLSLTCEAKTIRELFASEPDDIFMILPSRTRLDMLDYYDSGQQIVFVGDIFSTNSSTELIDVTDNYISLSLTESTEVAMQLLATSPKDSMLVVVNTAKLPARDSQISFYDTDWNKLNSAKIFKEPTIKDFIVKTASNETVANILDIVKFPIISYDLSTNDCGKLVAKLQLEEFLSKEDWKKVKPFVKDQLVYRKKGSQFKLSN